jgi:hypothetical protein
MDVDGDVNEDLLDYEGDSDLEIEDPASKDWAENLLGMGRLLNPVCGQPDKGAEEGAVAGGGLSTDSKEGGQPGAPDPSQHPPAGRGGEGAPAVDVKDQSSKIGNSTDVASLKAELTDALGDVLTYKAVSAAAKNKLTANDITTGESTQLPDVGTFLSFLDGRLRAVEVDVNFARKQAWTYSFDSKTMACRRCSMHKDRVPFPRRGRGGQGGRQVIWLGDHTIPPLLPVTSGLQCVKIMRLESGLLKEMAEGLVRVMAGRQITAGSVILMTSATNMAAAGTVGYVMDFLAAVKYLRSNMGDHLEFGMLPPFLLNGCNDEATIRTCLEVSKWANMFLKGSDVLLSDSMSLAEKLISDRGDSDRQTVNRCRLRLPSRPGNPVEQQDVSLGPYETSASVRTMEQEEEKQLVWRIVEEMREKLAVDLDQEPVVDRWPSPAAKAGDVKKSFLVVGSSHASKLAAELTSLGHSVELIFEAGWKAFKNSSCILAEKVHERMKEKMIDVVVFAVLDNTIYQVLTYNGDVIQARRDNNGHYHMDGDMMVMAKSGQYSLFNSLKPLLETAKGKGGILLSPFPRYVSKSCCADRDHMPNRDDPVAKQQLAEDLRQTAANFRDFLFSSSMRYIRVLEPAAIFRDVIDGDVWGDDAVHPTAAAYREMAASIIRLAEGALGLPIGGGKRQRPAENPGEPREEDQRGGGWQPLGGGRYLRYEDRDGGGGGGRAREDSNTRGRRQEVEVLGEYGGDGSGQGGGPDGYQGGGGGQRGGQRSRPWNGGRGYGGGGRRPRRS